MCKKMGACKHCSTKCLAIHGKKDDSGASKRSSFSFFKVIFNDKFLDILFLPPKFAKEFTSLANKKIKIKDTTGRHWFVTLSYVDDSLAFVRGWRTFTLDHGITIYDVVTVHHISGSDFVCQIYGKSGCEKRHIHSGSYYTTSLGSADKDSSTFSNARVNVNFTQSSKERSSTSHGKGVKRKSFEDPCCIIYRDIDFAQHIDRGCLFDLSEFELCKTKPVSEIGSSSVQDGGCSNLVEREHTNESLFMETIIDFSAFEEAMRIPCDIGNNDSSKHEISGKILQESCPSTSAGPSMDSQTAVFQGQTSNIRNQGPSLEGQTADLEAQTAAFQGQPTTIRDQGPSLDAQTVALPCETTTLRDQGPSVEAQTADLKAQAAAFQGQRPTFRYQDVVKDPKGFGNERCGSVRIAKNEHTQFNPEGFGGSVRIAKEERKEFNPVGLGGGVRNVKKEHKMFNPKGFGGSVRVVKEEQMEFNTNTFDFWVDDVSLKHGEISGQILPESRPSTFAGPSLEAQTAAFQGQTTTTTDQGPLLKAQTAFQGPSMEAQTADLEAQTAAFPRQTTIFRDQGPSLKVQTAFQGPSMEAQTADLEAQTAFSPCCQTTVFRDQGGSVRVVKKDHKELNPEWLGGSVTNVKKEHKMFNPEGFGGRARIVKKERMELNPNSVGGVAQRVKEKSNAKSFGGTGIVGKVKKEPMDSNPEHFGKNHYSNGGLQENGASQVLKRVKAEAVDFAELPSPLAVTCLVTSDNNFLVLPRGFFLLGYRRSMDLEKKVVMLRDSAQILWPLLCCKIKGLQVLTSGWKSFREAHGIQTGDECVFEVEDKFENIFKVDVVRK